MTYAEAMRRYGSDKPDLRFDLELTELHRATSPTPRSGSSRRPTSARWSWPAAASQPRRQLDAWQEFAKQRGHRGLAYVLVGDDGELGGPVAKNLSDAERAGLVAHVGAEPGRLRVLRRRRGQLGPARCSARPGSRSAGGSG